MARFGYTARSLGIITKDQWVDGIQTQLQQEVQQNGISDLLGDILVSKGALSESARLQVLQEMAMEPNILWGGKSFFASQLNREKRAKQLVGERVGQLLAARPAITVFLAHSSSVYYAFRGIVKHGAAVKVLTTNAAILSAYPSVISKVRGVTTIWRGDVDVDTAMIEPPDLNDAETRRLLTEELNGAVSIALIPATGFDAEHGPMGREGTAREVAKMALLSTTPTWILIDHTKVLSGTSPNDPALLFRNSSAVSNGESG